MLQSDAVFCSVLQFPHPNHHVYFALCSSVLNCVAMCCSVLQCIAVYCSVLQCVAVLTPYSRPSDMQSVGMSCILYRHSI